MAIDWKSRLAREGEKLELPAIAEWQALDFPLDAALAQLELATFASSGEVADRALAEARRVLAGLGAEGIVERLRPAVAPAVAEPAPAFPTASG